MLVLVQFPFADLRYFSHTKNRLAKPTWPPVFGLGLSDQFMRYFGESERRNRGPDFAWLDELAFYSARRAIRFTNLTLRKPYTVAFRRLLSDGDAVSRIEVGVNYTGLDEQTRYTFWENGFDETYSKSSKIDIDSIEAVRNVLNLPTVVAGDRGSLKPLGMQARPLTQLYGHATTPSELNFQSKLVKTCVPLVLVECGQNDFESLPSTVSKSPPDSLKGVRLGYGEVKVSQDQTGVWFICYGNSDFEYARSVRLCVTRLHAEREVLRCALDALQTSTIVYKARSDIGDRIEAYFNDKISLVTRKTWQGVEQSAIREVFDLSAKTLRPFEIGILEQKLSGARRQIALKVRAYSNSINIHIKDLDMSTTTITNSISNSQINAPVNMAQSLQGSFNTISNSSADSHVNKMLEELLVQIANAGDAFGENAENVAKDAQVLSEEVSGGKARRKWYELSISDLKEAAEAIGEVGVPIVKTLGKLLPALVALYP